MWARNQTGPLSSRTSKASVYHPTSDGAKSSGTAHSFARDVYLGSFLGNRVRLATYTSLGKSAAFLYWSFALADPFSTLLCALGG